MRQDISWFDENDPNKLSMKIATETFAIVSIYYLIIILSFYFWFFKFVLLNDLKNLKLLDKFIKV